MTTQELAYIAGFLDGDGCVMMQLIFRKDYSLGYQIRSSIVFYQKEQYRSFLEELKKLLGVGYIRIRNDGMAECTIVGSQPVYSLLSQLLPYLRLKRKQAITAMQIIDRMPASGRLMKPELLLSLASQVDTFAELNYSKRRTNRVAQVEEFLRSRNLISRRD